MRKPILIILCILCLGAQGCATYMYHGSIDAMDSAGKERHFILYWSKTDGLLWPAKAGPASLLTECGNPVIFVERPEGIVFRGTPGQDAPVGTPATMTQPEIPCGSFIGETKFVAFDEGPVMLRISCEPVTDEFAVQPRRYLQARPEPYRFDIISTKEWSLFGKDPVAPDPPSCRQP